jgi:hypothetical protein
VSDTFVYLLAGVPLLWLSRWMWRTGKSETLTKKDLRLLTTEGETA